MRTAHSLLTALLLLAPAVASARDPLDDVSGEEDFHAREEPETKAKSSRVLRQEGEIQRESEEHETLQFKATTEKEELIRDRAELREVREGIKNRDALGAGRTTAPRSTNTIKAEDAEPAAKPAPKAAEPEAKPAAKAPPPADTKPSAKAPPAEEPKPAAKKPANDDDEGLAPISGQNDTEFVVPDEKPTKKAAPAKKKK